MRNSAELLKAKLADAQKLCALVAEIDLSDEHAYTLGLVLDGLVTEVEELSGALVAELRSELSGGRQEELERKDGEELMAADDDDCNLNGEARGGD